MNHPDSSMAESRDAMDAKKPGEARAQIAERQDAAENGLPSLFEMAHFLRSSHPELPANMWVAVKNAPHGPRIIIQRNKGARLQINDTFSMTISDAPSIVGDAGNCLSAQEIAYFKEFVAKNKSTLLDYWEGKMDTFELLDKLVF